MLMLKRVVASAIIVVMLFCNVAIAQVIETPQDASFAEAIEKLSAFKILELSKDENFYPEEKMTRADFVALSMKVCGYDIGILGNQEVTFADVRQDMWYAEYIKIAFANGFISGSGSETNYFYPDQPITVQEAAKILVAAMGYEYLAQENGGYPVGYLLMANEIKLMQGFTIKNAETMTRGQAAQMLVNALEGDVLKLSDVSGGQTANYTKEKLLNSVHNIYMEKGVVTQNSITALGKDSNLKDGYIEIDGKEIYSAEGTNAEKLLGYNVQYAYLKEEGSNDYYKLLYIKKLKNNEEMVVKSQDILPSGAGYLEINDENNKTQKLDISSNAYFICNEKYISTFSTDLLRPSQGSVTLLDQTNDGTYDVVFINSYFNIIVGDKSDDTLTIYDKFEGENNVCVDTASSDLKAYIQNVSGEEVAFKDIKADTVLSVHRSQDLKFVRVIVSDQIIKGIVKEVSNDSIDSKVNIDDKEYIISKNYKDEMNSQNTGINVGQNVILYLDQYGYVAGHEVNKSTTTDIAYLVSAGLSDGISKKLSIKLFTRDSKHLIYTCAEKVKIDGEIPKTNEILYSKLLKNGRINNMLVSYQLNEQNEIKYIDTPAGNPVQREEKNTLFMASTCYTFDAATGKHSQGTALQYKINPKTFGFQVLINDGIPIFAVPDVNAMDAEESAFSIKGTVNLTNDQQLYIESYQLDENSFYSDALVIYESSSSGKSIDANSTIAVVKGTKQVIIDDEEKLAITALKDGKEIILTGADENVFRDIKAHSMKNEAQELYSYKNLRVGDVIRYSTLPDGTVGKVQMILGTVGERLDNAENPAAKEFACTEDSSSNKYAQARFVLKSVYAKNTGIIKLFNGDPATIDENDIFNMETHRATSYKIMVVDTSDIKNIDVRLGTINDIRDYKSAPEEYSSVLIQTRYGDPRSIVVIK